MGEAKAEGRKKRLQKMRTAEGRPAEVDGPYKISADLISGTSVIKFLVASGWLAGRRGHSLILLSHRAVGASHQPEREDEAPN